MKTDTKHWIFGHPPCSCGKPPPSELRRAKRHSLLLPIEEVSPLHMLMQQGRLLLNDYFVRGITYSQKEKVWTILTLEMGQAEFHDFNEVIMSIKILPESW